MRVHALPENAPNHRDLKGTVHVQVRLENMGETSQRVSVGIRMDWIEPGIREGDDAQAVVSGYTCGLQVIHRHKRRRWQFLSPTDDAARCCSELHQPASVKKCDGAAHK